MSGPKGAPMQPIDGPRHPAFAAACELTTALGRAAAERYLVEGGKGVRQAAAAGALLEAFVLDDHAALAEDLRAGGAAVWLLPRKLLLKLTGTAYETSPTVVGVARRALLGSPPTAGLLLVGEAIQDPRNVGVLIRTAEAAGAAAALFSDDSADPFGRPAVRSSTGSILRLPVYLAADLPADLRRLREGGVRVVATSARATCPAWEVDLRGDVAILVGNESAGLSEAARSAAETLVALPVAGGASSLNVTVAAGVLLYEAVRQRA